jgi:APA family basic amino acid/polyamine antiporter
MANSTTPNTSELLKGLRLFDCTTIVMGSMIGSGIFIVAAEIAREVPSPGLLLLCWVLSGVMTVAAAVTYGELAGMMPQAGGQYVYLREAFGPLFGFLYGWTLFLVIQTGTLAAVSVAFGKFLGVLIPWVSTRNLVIDLGQVELFHHSLPIALSSQQLVAVLALAFLTILNIYGLRLGAWVQNIFTTLKAAALFGLVFLGLWWSNRHPAATAQAQGLWQGVHWNFATLTVVAVALVGPLFSSDAWNNVTFTGSEIVNPKRNLPLSLLIGTATVCCLYVACNWVYLRVLPFAGTAGATSTLGRGIQYAAEDRVATAAAQVMLGGKGAVLMAAAIMISTFGCMNGMILAGARVYYAMAKDGLLFRAVGKVDPKHHTPAISLLVQAVWAALLTLSGSYSQLLEYVVFAVVLFYALTIAGFFWLRKKRPQAPRPYRAWGYPVLPAIYIVLALVVEWALLTHKTGRSLAGLCIVAVGVPVYFLWQRKGKEL